MNKMKRTTSIIAAMLAVAALFAGCGRETVIVNPEFDASGVAHYMALSRIERADTATVMYADVYNLPNYWVYLSSGGKLRDGKGKTYKLLACEGFQLDKEVFMPEDGTMSLVLYFEPVDKEEKVVDYIDLDEDNESITGIKLYNIKHAVCCLLRGEVIDRPQSSRLLLLKAGEDPRTTKIYIPVRDGKFEYTLHADAEEAYQLIFYDEIQKASWPIDFIIESGTLDFTLNPEDRWEENVVKGGKYTDAYHAVKDPLNERADLLYRALNEKIEQLYKENRYYTPEANALHEQIAAIGKDDNVRRRALFDQIFQLQRDGRKDLSEEAQVLDRERQDIIKTVFVDNMLEYAKTHPDVTGYTFLMENIRWAIEGRHLNLDAAPMLAIFHDVYEKKYPGHPYTSLMQSYEQAAAIQPGKPCPDVSALDASTGEEVRLADLIKGNKVTLVHLWASWCGPCRDHGMEMIPVYEAYKEKGFAVVGISREQKKEAMDMAVERDKYPWVNLLELNDEHGIWTKFGIGNAGGGEFLVDEQGNFLAVGTTPDEIKKILQALLD